MNHQRNFPGKSLEVLIIFLIIYIGYALLPILGLIGTFLAKILYPFVLSIILYYLLRPVVRILQTKMPIYLAITLTFCAVAIFFGFIIVYIYPVIIKQANTIVALPQNYASILKNNNLVSFLNYNFYISNDLKNAIANFFLDLNTMIIKNTIAIMSWITEFVMGLSIVPFILFYMLKDDRNIHKNLCQRVPEKYLTNFKSFFKEIDLTLAHFIQGRLLVSLCVSVLLLICFLVIGINYPILLFLFALMFYIIPTIGSFIAIIPPLLVGFSMSNTMGIQVLIIMAIASTLEGVLIAPKILGSTLYIHPLTVILILWISGLLFGVLGLVIAVPVYAILKVVFRHVDRYYLNQET